MRRRASLALRRQEPSLVVRAVVSGGVGLNTTLGERGFNTLRLLQGVIIGIVVGEIAIAVLYGGYGSLALATFVAMAIVARSAGPGSWSPKRPSPRS